VAPAFADMPGFVSETALANPETSTYGGVYVWRDREALENYKQNHV
jgi:heme-degrading monooxygenase HmoA